MGTQPHFEGGLLRKSQEVSHRKRITKEPSLVFANLSFSQLQLQVGS